MFAPFCCPGVDLGVLVRDGARVGPEDGVAEGAHLGPAHEDAHGSRVARERHVDGRIAADVAVAEAPAAETALEEGEELSLIHI